MKKILGLVLLLLVPASAALGYEVFFKNGKTLQGTLVRETEDSVILKDASGILQNFKKADMDLVKTAEANKKQKEPPAKKSSAHVVTKEELEALREKYDLGEKSFGKADPIDFGEEIEEADPDSDFEFEQEVLRSSVPVLVDFWASWCGPCREIAPRVDAVQKEFEGTAKVYRVNIDENHALAQRYHVSAIPTLLFFKEGKIADTIVGAARRDTIAKKLRNLVK